MNQWLRCCCDSEGGCSGPHRLLIVLLCVQAGGACDDKQNAYDAAHRAADCLASSIVTADPSPSLRMADRRSCPSTEYRTR